MRWLKFTAAGKTSWGIAEGEHVVAVDGDPFDEWQRGTQSHSLKDVKIELPLIPRTFYCVGLNYLKHLKEAADKAGTKRPVSSLSASRMSRSGSRWIRPTIRNGGIETIACSPPDMVPAS